MFKFKANSKVENKKENENILNFNVSSNSIEAKILPILNTISTSIGSLQTSVDYMNKQLDKMTIVDEDIKKQQSDLIKRIDILEKQYDYEISKIKKYLKIN